MHNNTQKQLPEKIEDVLIFAASILGLVFMVLYWR